MTTSYQFIAARLSRYAQRLEPFAWGASALAFFAIGLIDTTPPWLLRTFFWCLFCGPLVALVRRTPAMAFLSALIFGVMTAQDVDRYHRVATSPLLLTIALVCYSTLFLLMLMRLGVNIPHQFIGLQVIKALLLALMTSTIFLAFIVVAQYFIAVQWLDYHTLNQNVERLLFPIFFLTMISIFLLSRRTVKNGFISA